MYTRARDRGVVNPGCASYLCHNSWQPQNRTNRLFADQLMVDYLGNPIQCSSVRERVVHAQKRTYPLRHDSNKDKNKFNACLNCCERSLRIYCV